MSLRNELLGPGNTLTAFHLGSLPLSLIIFSIKNIVEYVYMYETVLDGDCSPIYFRIIVGILEGRWEMSFCFSKL